MTYLKYAWPSEGQFITDMLSAGFAELNEGEVSFVNCAVHQIGIVGDAQSFCCVRLLYLRPMEVLTLHRTCV